MSIINICLSLSNWEILSLLVRNHNFPWVSGIIFSFRECRSLNYGTGSSSDPYDWNAKNAGLDGLQYRLPSWHGGALIPMQRGAPDQPPHQPQQQLRRKDPGMGMQNTGYPQQKRCF